MLVVGSCQTSRLRESYILLGASQTGPGAPKQSRPISTWFYPDAFSSRCLKRVFSLHTRLLAPRAAGSHLTCVLGSPGPCRTVSSPWLLGELLDSPRHLLLHNF